MKLIWYEVRKLCMRRITLVILLLMLAVNAGLVLHSAYEPLSEYYTYNQITVSEFFDDHAGMTAGEMMDEISQWQSDYDSLIWFDEEGNLHWPTQEQTDALLTYTDSTDAEAEFYSLLQEKILIISDYEGYLDHIDEEAERMTQSSLFARPDTFSFRNIVKTQAAYQAMRSTVLAVEDSSGVKLALEPAITTVFLLFAAMLLVLNLIIHEREMGFLALIKPTQNGVTPTMWAKMAALAVSLAVLTLAFYGENMILGESLFGLGDLSRSIQSLDGYSASNLRITVGQYILLFLGAKILSLVAVGLLFFCVCLFVRKMLPACLIACGTLVGELALYWSIPLHSRLSPLRQINFISLLDTTQYFDEYQNMNLFGYPVNIILAALLTGMILIVLSAVLSLLRWEREETIQSLRSRAGKKQRAGISASLLAQETYKLFITQRGALILVLFLLLQLYTYSGMKVYIYQDEFYYQEYAQVLSGELTEEKKAYLEEQQSFFDSISLQLEEIEARAAAGEISENYADYQEGLLYQQLNRINAFQRAYDQYAYLEEQAARGYTVSFVMDTGYSALLSHEKDDVLDAGKLFFVLAAGLMAYFPMEYQSNVELLISASVRGKRSVNRCKQLAAGGYTLLAVMIAVLPRMIALIRIYRPEDWGASARSLSEFRYVSNGISIAVWFAVLLLLRVLLSNFIAHVTMLISIKTRNAVVALLIMLILLEVPVCLYLFGVKGEWGILPLITGHFYSVV